MLYLTNGEFLRHREPVRPMCACEADRPTSRIYVHHHVESDLLSHVHIPRSVSVVQPQRSNHVQYGSAPPPGVCEYFSPVSHTGVEQTSRILTTLPLLAVQHSMSVILSCPVSPLTRVRTAAGNGTPISCSVGISLMLRASSKA